MTELVATDNRKVKLIAFSLITKSLFFWTQNYWHIYWNMVMLWESETRRCTKYRWKLRHKHFNLKKKLQEINFFSSLSFSCLPSYGVHEKQRQMLHGQLAPLDYTQSRQPSPFCSQFARINIFFLLFEFFFTFSFLTIFQLSFPLSILVKSHENHFHSTTSTLITNYKTVM